MWKSKLKGKVMAWEKEALLGRAGRNIILFEVSQLLPPPLVLLMRAV
jgi:hypothetical protein